MCDKASVKGMGWPAFPALLLLCSLSSVCADISRLGAGSGVGTRCDSQACNPRMGNLALGRRMLTQSVCGSNSTEPFCSYLDPSVATGSCPPPNCGKCSSAHPQHAHPASAMADSSFRHPGTWWQSAGGKRDELVQLDLETEFYFTHLIVVFRSPRPGAMVLERSQDFARSWTALAYFARNCTEAFGLEEGALGGDGPVCTSKYSSPFPCTKGEQGGEQLSTFAMTRPRSWPTALHPIQPPPRRPGDGDMRWDVDRDPVHARVGSQPRSVFCGLQRHR